jgi:hypothetical protein
MASATRLRKKRDRVAVDAPSGGVADRPLQPTI